MPRPSSSARARLVLGFAAACLLLLVRCAASDPEAFGPGVQSLGTFHLCLQRTLDTCHMAESACDSPAVEASRSATLGVRPTDGTFLWTRPGLSAATGRQVGERFELQLPPLRLPKVCGCEVELRETVRGEFLSTAPDQRTCVALDGGTSGCSAGEAPPLDDAPWLPDAGLPETGVRFHGLSARVVDEIVPVADAGACGCAMPCRIEYDLSGTL